MTPTTSAQPRRRVRRTFLTAALVVLALCVLAGAASALSNRTLPPPPDRTDTLTTLDQARAAEALRLEAALGDAVWPGFGAAGIPLTIYNSENSFLIGAVADDPRGWERVEGVEIAGEPVYRQPAYEEQAFAEQIAPGQYAGSMATKYELDSGLRELVGGSLPGPLGDVVPYRLMLTSTEQYITALVHESFHAYQAMQWPERFEDAERAYASAGEYEAALDGMADARRAEAKLLLDALAAEDDAEAAEHAREFLAQRAARREAAGLSEEAALYEPRFEWLEGLAKYVELGIWQAAYEREGYDPLPALADDPFFHDYENYPRRWRSERSTMRTGAARGGDTPFYYSGMAQARLLDRLMPGWQARVGEPGVWLEDLLAEAVSG